MGLLKILYRDEHVVAIHKPESLLVHRARISRDQIAALQLLRDQIGQFVYPVHRLDRPTSGVLLFALSSEATARMKEQFDRHTIQKTYLAITRGVVAQEQTLDYPLRHPETKTEQAACTRFKRLATVQLDDVLNEKTRALYCLAAAWPKTGRMHQIRRHLKHLFHPIIGDTTYGDSVHNRFFREKFGCYRLLLHAYQLSFVHPYSQQPLTITAPLPEEIQHLFTTFGWPDPAELLQIGS